jgi:acyl-coenzyme A synthetase/AMP-(fatty) acid ligase
VRLHRDREPGSATKPFPGVEADAVNDQGKRAGPAGPAIWS